jgi:hypothetical protein
MVRGVACEVARGRECGLAGLTRVRGGGMDGSRAGVPGLRPRCPWNPGFCSASGPVMLPSIIRPAAAAVILAATHVVAACGDVAPEPWPDRWDAGSDTSGGRICPVELECDTAEIPTDEGAGPDLGAPTGAGEASAGDSPAAGEPCSAGCAQCWRDGCVPACETRADCVGNARVQCVYGGCYLDCSGVPDLCPGGAGTCWPEGPAGFPACGA